MGFVTIGIDIGQRVDPTAIAVVEMEWRKTPEGREEDHHVCRHLERLPLGTPYPKVADRLEEIVAGVIANAQTEPTIYVDSTGVGVPVCDVLSDRGISVSPVFFTHGDKRTPEANGQVKLGKAWLVSQLQALLQTDRLHLPRTSESEVLAKELLDYEIRVSEDANERYGAFRVGSHDDLVTALGLAVQPPGSRVAFWHHWLESRFRDCPVCKEDRLMWYPDRIWRCQTCQYIEVEDEG